MSDKSIKNEEKLSLINAIHNNTCLWNPIDKVYRNSVIRTMAWNQIAESFNRLSG